MGNRSVVLARPGAWLVRSARRVGECERIHSRPEVVSMPAPMTTTQRWHAFFKGAASAFDLLGAGGIARARQMGRESRRIAPTQHLARSSRNVGERLRRAIADEQRGRA